MPTANSRKGAETERLVAKYFREQGVWMADRYLREGRKDDKGDIEGVPFTTVQVKYVQKPAIQTWITATLKQRDNAGTPYCLLVVRRPMKKPEAWDAWMPYHQLVGEQRAAFEAEAWTWVRMDLRLAVAQLAKLAQRHSLSDPSLSTISPPSATWVQWDGVKDGVQPSVPSTERAMLPSRTISTLGFSIASPATPEEPPST